MLVGLTVPKHVSTANLKSSHIPRIDQRLRALSESAYWQNLQCIFLGRSIWRVMTTVRATA